MEPRPRNPVFCGLQPSEQLLRGGALRCPTLLTGLLLHDGRSYVGLRIKCHALRRFVLPTGKVERAAVVQVFAGIASAYNAKIDELLTALAEGREEAKAEAEPASMMDKTAALGLDTPVEFKPSVRNRKIAREARQVRLQLPDTISVPWQLPGELWQITCLVQKKLNRGLPIAVSMAVTDSNMSKLHLACVAQLGAMSTSLMEPTLPFRAAAARPPKRTREGAPEYWDRSKDRWVSRVRISGRGEVKRTKTLSRKPTDPDVRPGALSSPVPRQLAALHPPEALDPFSGSPAALASSSEGAIDDQRPSVDLTALLGID